MGDPSAPRIGVVDDNPATLYSTARVLRRANFEVSEGVTGAQALALAESADLLLLDVHLPDIHGFEVCKRLRANPRTARLPIIHISATFVTEINKAQGLDAGGDGYLTHPIEPLVLVATVNAFLRARRAEDEMRTNEAKFKAVFDNASSGILLLDCQLTLLEVNPAMCTLLQRQREQIVGKPLSFFVPPEHGLDLVQIARELEAQGTWRGVLSLLRPDGQAVFVECHISAHSFPGVRLAIATDITERLRLERERDALLGREQAARAQAERANRLKDDFLSTLSHELRSPLNSILMWTELLRQQVDNRAQLSRGLAAIERNTRLQADLISELLDVSRIVSGKLRLDIQPVDPAKVIQAALEGLTPAREAKALVLKTSFDPRLGMISADPARLQQVILESGQQRDQIHSQRRSDRGQPQARRQAGPANRQRYRRGDHAGADAPPVRAVSPGRVRGHSSRRWSGAGAGDRQAFGRDAWRGGERGQRRGRQGCHIYRALADYNALDSGGCARFGPGVHPRRHSDRFADQAIGGCARADRRRRWRRAGRNVATPGQCGCRGQRRFGCHRRLGCS